MIKFKRVMAFLLTLILCLTISNSTVFAAESKDVNFVDDSEITLINEPGVSPYYQNIDYIYATIEAKGTKVYLSTTVVANKKTDIKILMCLERLDEGIYIPVADWQKSGNGTSLNISASRIHNVLKKYRLRAIVTVGGEKATIYRYL